MLVILAPLAATILSMVTLTLNLWLAGKITQTSGRLNRPWPELRSTALPSMTLVALLVAAVGWGPLAAAIGGVGAASVLGAIFGLPYSIAFAMMVAVPGWWLGHRALLGRPIEGAAGDGATQQPPALEWYPVGRILLWIAAFAVITTTATLLTLGADTDT
ncbi:MAG: hypothetical protein ACK463_06820, partial [Bradyrhizobium sp.]